MDQHVNVQPVYLVIHSQEEYVQLINAHQVTRVPMDRYVLVVVVNIIAKILCAVLEPHVIHRMVNVPVNLTLLEILI